MNISRGCIRAIVGELLERPITETMETTTLTSDELRRRLQVTTDETSDALKQYSAIGELRRKVTELHYTVTHGATDAECDAAAVKVVKASEDLRLAELVEPRKKAASDSARARRAESAVGAIQSIANHFESLNNEACAVARQILLALPPPMAVQLRPEEGGYARDAALGAMLNWMPGVVESGTALNRANGCRSSRECAESNAEAMLETFEAETSTIRTQIDRLRSILAVVVPATAETVMVSAGGGLGDSSGAPAKPEKTAKASKAAATTEPASV